MGKPTPQDKVNLAAEHLKDSDTKLQLAGAARIAAGYLLPPGLKLVTTGLSLLAGFEGGKRYHDYREYKETLEEAQNQKNVKDTYPGFFHWPSPQRVERATEDLKEDVKEAYDMANETLDQVKKSLD